MNMFLCGKTRLLLGISLFFAFGNLLLAQLPGSSQKEPIIGKWREFWTGGGPVIVEYHANGTANWSNGLTGNWQSLPAETEERKYEVISNNGLFIDHLTLSADTIKLKGKNIRNINVWEEKLATASLSASAESERIPDLSPAISAKISSSLTSHICRIDAPKFNYVSRRELDNDGAWHALDGDFHGTWKIVGNQLLITVVGQAGTEHYTLSPSIIDPFGMLSLTGIGANGDHVTFITTEETPQVGVQNNTQTESAPRANGGATFFGTAHPGN